MKPHGLKGDLTISLNPDSPDDWDSIKMLFVENDTALVPYFIEKVSARTDKAIIKLEDVSTPEQASLLKNKSVFLPLASRPKLETGDFYDDEVIGFEVSDDHIGLLGLVEEIERAGSNRFLILRYQQKEIMIPVQYPLLKSINKSKKKISVNLPDGFLDI